MPADPQQPSAWIPIVQTALGGALAIVGGLIAVVFTENGKHRREVRRLASAFQGEIEALGELKKVRRIREQLIEGKRLYESGKQFEHWSYEIEELYTTVYRTNTDKIGLFEAPIPAKLAKFYSLTAALMESLRSYGNPVWHLRDTGFMLRAFEQDLHILDVVERLGVELSKELFAIG